MTWLLPSLVSAAVTLHVALEHSTSGGHHRVPAGSARAALPGHQHGDTELPHRHAAVLDVCRFAAPQMVSGPSPATGGEFLSARTPANADPALRVNLPPPRRDSGPPLLARLSTLRI